MSENFVVPLKGSLELQINENGFEAALVFSPHPEGEQWDRRKAYTLLEKNGVREGIDSRALDSLFDPEQTTGKRSIVAARGTPPQEGRAARQTVASLSIPDDLKSYEDRVIGTEAAPRVFARTVVKKKIEKSITKKPKLPFLPAKEEKEVAWVKEEIITPLEHPGAEQGRGYAHKADVIAKISPGERARAGRSVLGDQIPVAQAADNQAGIFLGEGLKQVGNEVRAQEAGFFRYGENWMELFPFSPHEHKIYPSPDRMTCLLDFVPGSELAAAPTVDRVLEECRELGFSGDSLLGEEEVAYLLSRALTDHRALKGESLSRAADRTIQIDISEDKLNAHLTLSKGQGTGKILSLKEVGDAIRRQKLKGMDISRVTQDILDFHRSTDVSLENYLLVQAREPQKGEDGRIEWKIEFFNHKQVEAIKKQTQERGEQLEMVKSIEQFPIDMVEQMAEVGERAGVAEVHPATVGQAGVDVFGTVLPGIKGKDVNIDLFENLQRIRNEIVSLATGLLETGSREQSLLLRVRSHRDREILVNLSEDRMEAFLTVFPAEGTGIPIDAQEVEQALAEAGIGKGMIAETLSEAVNKAQNGEKVDGVPVARGQEPEHGRDTDLEIVVQQASGQRVTVHEDGRADYRKQDKVTTVEAHTLLARQPAPTAGTEGWDVTGQTIPARHGSARYVHVGKNVDCREQEDGTLLYYAKIKGELDYPGGSIDVLQVHTVPGNVGLKSGNVKFPGSVRIQGSVQTGFSVIGEEKIFVEESIQGALLSAGDSIEVGKGIVGEGKAVLRAKKSIRAHFAEQATLLAVENIRLANACLRCTIKCNGKIVLESEKGNIIGGRVYCKLGLEAMNIGSQREIATEIFFGQDILVQDQVERELRHSQKLQARNAEIERAMKHLKPGSAEDLKKLEKLRNEKRQNLQLVQMHSKRIFILQERYEQHFPSEITVRGVIYPGVVLRSHGRQRRIKTALREVVFFFNTTTGRIEERALNR